MTLKLFLVGSVALAMPLAAVPARPVAASTSPRHQRLLPLQGGQNFRDLGGYRTRDGRTVRWGMLYRSGSMHFLTAVDYAYLNRLGIRTVCDFRDTRERAVEPALWPAGTAPRILTDDYQMNASGIGLKPGAPLPTAEQAHATMAGLYPQLLVQFNGQYRRMFAELVAGHVPLAFNCTAGKDRTGVAAALVLTALGVPHETVVEDYLLTNRYFDPQKVVRGDQQASGAWRQLPPAVLRAYMAADPSYIEAALRVVETHAGGVDGYFRDELGVSRADLLRLRRMFTV